MSSTGGNDTVSNKQLYDELLDFREYLDKKLDTKAGVDVTDDHETRIRALERFRYAVPGASAVAVLVSAGALILGFLH